MEGYIVDWLNLGIRWLHFIAGVAWIVVMVMAFIELAMGGHPSPIWVCFLNATWVGFLYALAVGRTIGLAATVISFILEPTPKVIYYVLGGILLLYPMYLFWVSRVKKHYAFL